MSTDAHTTPHAEQPLGHGHAPAHAKEGHPLVGHLVPLWIMFATGTALIVLTALTVAAHQINMGEFNIVIALVIAVVKATLVGLFFMHLRWDRAFNQLVFVGSVIFVALLMWFCTLDTKQYEPTLIDGNPKGAQEVLDRDSPNAPIAKKKALIR